MAKRNAKAARDAKLQEDARKQIALVEAQREKHRVTIDDAHAREDQLRAWIAEREESIRAMRAELDGLPAKVVISRSVISRLDDTLATLRATVENAKSRDRKRKTLARLQDQIATMQKEVSA